MKKTAATQNQYNGANILYLALELGKSTWKLVFTVGFAQRPRVKTIAGSELERLVEEIEKAKERFGLLGNCQVVSCYEAGRDGFWLHRCLEAWGITNHRSRSRGAASGARPIVSTR